MCKKDKKRKRPKKPESHEDQPIDEAIESCSRSRRAKQQKKRHPLITPAQVTALVKETLDRISGLKLDYSASWRSYPGFQVQGAKATLTLGGKSWTAKTAAAHAELEALAKAVEPEPMETEESEAEETAAAAAPAAAAAAADKRDGIWIDETGHIVYRRERIPKGAMKTRPDATQEQWKKFRASNRKLPKDLPDDPMDHCGYCTFFLTFLGIPTEQPTTKPSTTAGSRDGAQSALRYGIPDFIRTNPHVIKRLFTEDESEVARKFLDTLESSFSKSGKSAAAKHLDEWRKKTHSLAEVIAYIEAQDSNFLNEELWVPFENFLTEALHAYKLPSASASSSSSSTAPAPPHKR